VVLGLFGPAFGAAQLPLIILLVGQLVNAAAGSVGWLLLLTGYQNQGAFVYGCVAGIHLALLGVLVPWLGIEGAAIATTVSLSVWNIWLHHLVVRRLDIHPSVIFAVRQALART
jgi:O-antigen/teichoic acid export membrane protein